MAKAKSDLDIALAALKASQKAEIAALKVTHSLAIAALRRRFAPAPKVASGYRGAAPKRPAPASPAYRGFAPKREGLAARAPAKPKSAASYRGFYSR